MIQHENEIHTSQLDLKKHEWIQRETGINPAWKQN